MRNFTEQDTCMSLLTRPYISKGCRAILLWAKSKYMFVNGFFHNYIIHPVTEAIQNGHRCNITRTSASYTSLSPEASYDLMSNKHRQAGADQFNDKNKLNLLS